VRDETGGSLQSVNRALTALELVADAGEIGVSELGRPPRGSRPSSPSAGCWNAIR